MGHGYAVPMNRMKEWVQDALDLVEYARGPVDGQWGAMRAAAGHPAPFKLNYLEIGNENGGSAYAERFALFHDALKAKYPDLHLVANFWDGEIPKTRPVEIQDEHYYLDTIGFLGMADHYQRVDRKDPLVYVGEYAVANGAGNGNFSAALGRGGVPDRVGSQRRPCGDGVLRPAAGPPGVESLDPERDRLRPKPCLRHALVLSANHVRCQPGRCGLPKRT
jgi:hypothetical protein